MTKKQSKKDEKGKKRVILCSIKIDFKKQIADCATKNERINERKTKKGKDTY